MRQAPTTTGFDPFARPILGTEGATRTHVASPDPDQLNLGSTAARMLAALVDADSAVESISFPKNHVLQADSGRLSIIRIITP
jgi:hypothetical protein